MAWYNSSWLYRVGVTALATQVGETALNYPLYLPLSLMPAGFWSHVLNGGGDIRVTNSTGTTEIPREIVSCNTGTQVGEVHLQADAVSASANRTFYIYYGNSGASDYGVGESYGRNAVWAAGMFGGFPYERVFHLGDSGATATDSTGNGSGTWNGNLPNVATGKLLNGQSFDGVGDYVNTGRAEGSTWTWSTWFKPDDLVGFHTIACIDTANFLLVDTSGTSLSFWSQPDGLGNINLGITGLQTGTWYHLGIVREGDNTTNGIKAYLNGVLTGQANTGTWVGSGNVLIGARPSVGTQDFDGVQDEARFIEDVKSAGSFLTDYNNQNSPATFWSIGAEELAPVDGPFCVQAIQGYRGGRVVRTRTGGAHRLQVRAGGAASITVECNRN